MAQKPFAYERTLAHLGSILVLMILILFTYANYFVMPFAGFEFNPSNNEIVELFLEKPPSAALVPEDILIQIGSVSMETYNRNLRQTFFDGVEQGQTVPIQLERDGEQLSIPWVYPGLSAEELVSRSTGTLLVGYFFWVAGLVTVLLVRPIRAQSRLLTAFFFLTAVWTAAGNLSAWHVWESAILQRMAIWLCVPVYLHLHWEFPRSLRPLPNWFWQGLYGLAGVLAVLQLFQVPDKNAYLLGFLVAVGGSVGLLLLRLFIRPAERRDIGLLFSFSALAFIPLMLFGLLGLTDEFPDLGRISLLALPLLPLGYFYAIFRRQVGGLENRINRALVVYLFGLLLLFFSIGVYSIAPPYLGLPIRIVFAVAIATVFLVLASLWFFPKFQRTIERRFLNIPLPPTHLVENYAARITTSLDRASLVRLLQGEILASLLVRESALFHLGTDGSPDLIYVEGIPEDCLPAREALAALQAEPARLRDKTEPFNKPLPFPWARLVLPLHLGGESIGVWLLGRRDPDDYYAAAEIAILETLANQTAVALQNIFQKERLQSLFQANIDRHEGERARLARYLHDDVLNELVVLGMQVDEFETLGPYDATYQKLASRIRRIIHGLRPAMLSYGLGAGIQELADNLIERVGDSPQIQLTLPPSDVRYPPRVEEHLFRITQQACENVLQHAEADFLRIEGRLEPDGVTLSVVDDGSGFTAGDKLNLNQLLADHHYGIAGMIERAALIGAEVQVASNQGLGTRVHITWEPDGHTG